MPGVIVDLSAPHPNPLFGNSQTQQDRFLNETSPLLYLRRALLSGLTSQAITLRGELFDVFALEVYQLPDPIQRLPSITVTWIGERVSDVVPEELILRGSLCVVLDRQPQVVEEVGVVAHETIHRVPL